MSNTLKKFLITIGFISLPILAFAVNPTTSIPQIGGDIHVVHSNGSGYWLNATTSSDTGRGTALLTAASALVSNDQIILGPKAFTVAGGKVDLSKGGTIASTSIKGSGKYNTVIKGQKSSDFVIQVASSSVVSDLNIICTNTSGFCFPVGNQTAKVQDVLIQNVAISGTTDGIYFKLGDINSTSTIANVLNADIDTNWDGVFTSSLGTINIYDSRISTVATASVNGGATAEPIMNSNGGIVNVYNTKLVATSGTSANNGVLNSGTSVNVYGGSILTSGVNAYDLNRNAGIVSVTSNTIYDVTKTLGTITRTDANQIIKSFNNGTINVGAGTASPSARLQTISPSALSGTGTINDDTTGLVTGTGTVFTSQLNVGDYITGISSGETAYVVSITSDTLMQVSGTVDSGGVGVQSFTYTQPSAKFSTAANLPGLIVGSAGNVILPSFTGQAKKFNIDTPLNAFTDGPATGGDYEVSRFDTVGTGNPYFTLGFNQTGGGYMLYEKNNDVIRFGSHGSNYFVRFGALGGLIGRAPGGGITEAFDGTLKLFPATIAQKGLVLSSQFAPSAANWVNNQQVGYADYLQVKTATGTVLTLISGNGSIGVGTTTPWRQLSITGSSDLGNNALAGSFTATSTTATSTFAGGFYVKQNATSTPYIYSTASGKGGAIIMEDEGGGACTLLTTKAGVLKAAVTTCPTEI